MERGKLEPKVGWTGSFNRCVEPQVGHIWLAMVYEG